MPEGWKASAPAASSISFLIPISADEANFYIAAESLMHPTSVAYRYEHSGSKVRKTRLAKEGIAIDLGLSLLPTHRLIPREGALSKIG